MLKMDLFCECVLIVQPEALLRISNVHSLLMPGKKTSIIWCLPYIGRPTAIPN